MTEFESILVPIAADFARKFGRYGTELDDVAQELRIWVFRHPEKIATWEGEHEPWDVDKLVARSLRHEANRYCQQIKAQSVGYSYDDLAWYSRGELKVLLDAMFDREAWTEPPVSESGGRSRRDPATGGNWIAMLADVAQAFDRLSERDRNLLRVFHEHRVPNVTLADREGVSPQAMSAKHQKALDRLLRLMGGERPRNTHDEPECECEQYLGTRRVISNAAARAAQDNYYEETA